MEECKKISKIQEKLKVDGIDGWLLYDHHGSNPFLRAFFDETVFFSRRFLYWIPQLGDPVVIVHQIEKEQVGHQKMVSYLSYSEYSEALKSCLKGVKIIAMEYSRLNKNPEVSVVDAGTFELVSSFGVKIVSSSHLLQHFTSVLSEEQQNSHIKATQVLEICAQRAFDLIADRIRASKQISELEVQKFILSEFMVHNCISEEGPCCAVNGNSAIPHYIATKKENTVIKKGDLVLIDLWCKEKKPHGIYADITRVAYVGSDPHPKMLQVFENVLKAQDAVFTFIQEKLTNKQEFFGYEVDQVCRKSMESSGYLDRFIHRTGHSIDSNVHGSGAHLDSLENFDERRILKNTIYSVEPGIYLPGEFGIRLEDNIIIGDHLICTTKQERSLICIL